MNRKRNWATVYKNQAPQLLGMVRRYVRNKEVAEDILHDGFIMAINKEQQFKETGSIGAWLRKIVLNTTLSYLRKNKDNIVTDELDHLEITKEGLIFDQIEFENQLTPPSLEELLEAIDALPEHHRTVFNLYVLDQHTHNEIGEMLSISPGTSKSHLARGRKKLQQILVQNEQKKDEKSRKALLWFLFADGWEERIDNTYKNTFSNFEVTPDNQHITLDTLKNHTSNTTNHYSQTSNWIVGGLFIVTAIITLINLDVFTSTQDPNAESFIPEKSPSKNHPKRQIHNNPASKPNNKKVSNTTTSARPKVVKENSQVHTIPLVSYEKEKSINKSRPAAISQLDSTITNRKKQESIIQEKETIVVPKKIIKKKKVYIPKDTTN